MEALGINAGLLSIQVLISMVLVTCAVPMIGSLAYWIVKPIAESRV